MAQAGADGDRVLVRSYTAKGQAQANSLFQADASALASDGFRPTEQAWIVPSRGRILVTPVITIVALMLVFFVVGGALASGEGVVDQQEFNDALLYSAILGAGLGAIIGAAYAFDALRRVTLAVKYTREA